MGDAGREHHAHAPRVDDGECVRNSFPQKAADDEVRGRGREDDGRDFGLEEIKLTSIVALLDVSVDGSACGMVV